MTASHRFACLIALFAPLTAARAADEKFGPFGVCKTPVPTRIVVGAGDTVRVVAEGKVNYGSGVPLFGLGDVVLDADGDGAGAPADYPAPSLRKNSLIARVDGAWYQGGIDKSFHPTGNGELVLYVNDGHPHDNSHGYSVTVIVTRKNPAPKVALPPAEEVQAAIAPVPVEKYRHPGRP